MEASGEAPLVEYIDPVDLKETARERLLRQEQELRQKIKDREKENPLGWPFEDQKPSDMRVSPYERSLIFMVRGFKNSGKHPVD